jgi:hypothetical protein
MKVFIAIAMMLIFSNSFASSPITFQNKTALSLEDKNLISNYIEKNCSNVSSVSELKTIEVINSAPEDLFQYVVVSSFEARYLFDGTHPVTSYFEIELNKLKSETDYSIWTTNVSAFKGLEEFCTQL